MYLKRDIEQSILKAESSFQAIVVYGARQVGKSTTVEALFGNRFESVTLDDASEWELAKTNPKGFLEVHTWPLIIDEVQKAPNLLSQIKIAIDEQRKAWMKTGEPRSLMYVLTGSNQFELQEGISESLAGRAAVFSLASLTQIEAEGKTGSAFNPHIDDLLKKERETDIPHKTKAEIFKTIFRGGMPDIVALNSERDLYFKSYFDTYVAKDVMRLVSASHEMQFRRFVSYLAYRTAQQVNYEVYARELGIDSATIKRWLSILVTSGIVVLLEPYMASVSKRIIKAPKVYFMDTGLCAYLCKWPNERMLESCAMAGAFFETFVVSEVIKSLYNHGIDVKQRLFYYRDIDQKEIDLLYVEGNSLFPIEIKKGEAPSKPSKNFAVLDKYGMKVMPGLVIDNCDKIRPINEMAYSFPVSLLGF